MKLTPLQRRAERKLRNQSGLDMNLVSLIDVFTILIFFLMFNTGVETLPSPQAVKLPTSVADKAPRENLVVVVSGADILVAGRRVSTVAEAMASTGDVIEPLKAELDFQASRQIIRTENQSQGQAITIMGDKDIPYSLLKKVMVTASRANFSDVSFAVRQRDAS